jgi:hypothetical protein
MSHWHECRICKEYFACHCQGFASLSVCCQDCAQSFRQTLIVESALKRLLRLPTSNN